MAYDLLLKDQEGRLRQRERAESMASALARLDAFGGLCEVHSSYSDPDDLDVEMLAELLEEDPLAVGQFKQSCHTRAVDPDQAKTRVDVASDFLDSYWGSSLASAKLPWGRDIPKMALSMGFSSFGFPPDCHPSYGASGFCPGGPVSH